MPHMFTIVSDGTDSNLTIFAAGLDSPITAHSSQPHYAALEQAAREGAPVERLRELADLSVAVSEHFEKLSDRVAVANGRIYFDGDEIDNSLTKQVVRFLNEGVNNWIPLVNFFEKVQSNPDRHSREQLYEWLSRHDFTITNGGDLVGYKGVRVDEDGQFVSIHRGPAIVDGTPVNGHVPNAVGSEVEIARSKVHSDPSIGCSTGLHVGTYDYAKSFSRGTVLRVSVNPRDVVSVPTDCDAQKVRVCRYYVEEIIDAELAVPLLADDFDEFGDEIDKWLDEDDQDW